MTARVRRVRARVEGTVQGVGFRPFVYRLASRARPGGLRPQRRARRAASRSRAARPRSTASCAGSREEAPPLAAIEAVRPRDVAPAGERGFRILASPHGGEPAALVSPDTATCDGLPGRAVRPRRPALPLPVRQLHELRAALHDRARRPLRPAADDDGRLRAVHALRGGVRGPGRPALPRPAERVPGVRADAAAAAGRPTTATRRCAARSPRCARARSSRSRASAATTSPAWRRASRRSPRCARASTARTSRSRSWCATSPPRASSSSLTDEEAALLAGRDRPIVLAPRPAGRAGRGVGRAALGRPRRAAALLAAAPPAARRRRGAARDDERQRLRRADRARGRRRAGAAGRDRRPRALPRPPDPHAHGRLGAARGARPAAAADAALARLRARLAGAAGRRRRARCSPAGPSSRARSASPRARARGSATTSATSRPTRCCRPTRRGSSTSSGCSRSRPRWSSTTSTPTTSRRAYALAREGVETVAVQHHHAHLAACLAEHGETGPGGRRDLRRHRATGATARVWGGELLVGDLRDFERAGHLWPVRLPGGDRAVRQPWRMACAWLLEAGWDGPLPGAGPAARASRSPSSCARGLSSPLTTSMGRLFDAVAALCGLRDEVTYEGQAAIELEAVVDPAERGALRAAVPRRRARRAPDRARGRRADVARGGGPGRGLRALPRRGRARDGGGVRRRRRSTTRRALGRRVPEPPAARGDRDRARGARAARARARAPAAQRRRDLVTGRRRWRPRGTPCRARRRTSTAAG